MLARAAFLLSTAAALAQVPPAPEPEFAVEITLPDGSPPMYSKVQRGQDLRQALFSVPRIAGANADAEAIELVCHVAGRPSKSL